MDRLVHYCEGVEPSIIQVAASDVEVVAVYSRHRLAQALIDEPSLLGAILDLDEMTTDWLAFVESVLMSFPLLPVLLITPELPASCPDTVMCLLREAPESELRSAIGKLTGSHLPRERREHHRYQWPLRATIGTDDTVHRISEISAGGAFLEPVGTAVRGGEEHEITIYFQNFRMRTRCSVLDARHVSSKNTNGFGIRFTNLSPEGTDFIDSIVHDALIATLTDPTAEPEIPMLNEEEDLLSIGEEFALM